MNHPALALVAVPDSFLLLATVGPAALALVLTTWAVRRRAARPQKRQAAPAVKVAALAALGSTAYSADTSWRFAADYLNMSGTAERAGMFGAAELALFATALMARQNLATQGAPGLPGTLVWVITTVQVIPSYAESGPVGGTVRAFVGPVMAAMLWHLAMGIELRLHTPGAASQGLVAVLGRELRERLLSRLGIAARDRDAAQITRDRATARAVALAARLAERTPAQQRSRRGRRLTRRLSRAVGRASVGTDAHQREQLLDQLAARRHALALATAPLPSPWAPAHGTETAAAAPSHTATKTQVPVPGPHDGNGPGTGRGPTESGGPVPELTDVETSSSAGTEGAGVGTGPRDSAGTGATSAVDTDASAGDAEGAGTGFPAGVVAGQSAYTDRGPVGIKSGTEPTGDRGPATPNTGTEPTGDQAHLVALRRKPTAKTRAGSRANHSRSHSPQPQRPTREPEESVEQLVRQVSPHVPALLERDGNEAVTRVQLREILRREGLKGGRNERLSLVLQELRSTDTTKTTRSTAR